MKLYIMKFKMGGKKYCIRVYAYDLESATQMVRMVGGEPYALMMKGRS